MIVKALVHASGDAAFVALASQGLFTVSNLRIQLHRRRNTDVDGMYISEDLHSLLVIETKSFIPVE